MTRFAAISVLSLAALAGCLRDETISGFVPENAVWTLTEGPGLPAGATIAFPQPGQVTGQAPCNRYTAVQSAPYPWIDIKLGAVTKMACPALDQEADYFAALSAATLVEVVGDVLILSDAENQPLLTFTRQPPV